MLGAQMRLECLKGFDADIVLHFACVLGCGLRRDAEVDQPLRQYQMPLINPLGNLSAAV